MRLMTAPVCGKSVWRQATKIIVQKMVFLYNKSMTKLIQYPLHKTNRSFHVPSSVRTIRSNSFNDNNYLRNLTISAGAIGNYAFQGMTKLRTVRITQGTKKIGKEAFLDVGDCPGLILRIP